MSVYSWPKDPIRTLQGFEARALSQGARGDHSALVIWAVWTVDSLFYLEEIVNADRTDLSLYAPHNPATKAVAHLRWAAGSAITAIDLCAAVAARELGLWTGGNEFDARKLVNKRNDLPAVVVGGWPPDILRWLEDLTMDPDYPIILGARHPLTHARVIRHFTTADRSIRIDMGGTLYTTDELIVLARKLATKQVEAFLDVVEIL